MIPVIQTKDGFAPIGGNPTLTSLDGEKRAPLTVILHPSWSEAERAEFGVFLAEPAAVPNGKRIAGDPSFSVVDGKVIEVRAFEDLLAPPDTSTAEAALAKWADGLGITLGDIRLVFGRSRARPALDLALYRCPPLRPADRAAFGQAPAQPPAGSLTEAGAKRWIDALELQVEARNRAGRRVVGAYDACRGGGKPAPTS